MRDLSRGKNKKIAGKFWLPRGFFAHAIAKADRMCYNKHKQIDDRSFHRKVVMPNDDNGSTYASFVDLRYRFWSYQDLF